MTLVRLNNRPLRTMFPEFFNEVFENQNSEESKPEVVVRKPLSNVKETKLGYQIEFALPGFSKKDVDINVENDVLTVSNVKEAEAHEDETYSRREFFYDNFKRSFSLPEKVDQAQINATFSDGILRVELPVKPELKPKALKIDVK